MCVCAGAYQVAEFGNHDEIKLQCSAMHDWWSDMALCWFQTSLPLAALPLRRVIIACCFRVNSSQRPRRFGFSPSGIAPELNWSQLYAICRGGQSGKVIDWLARRCLPLGHPSAASGACAVVQISPSKRQCGKRQASLKAALLYPSQVTSDMSESEVC